MTRKDKLRQKVLEADNIARDWVARNHVKLTAWTSTRKAFVTPDGGQYLAMAEGRRVASPFYLRWLIPKWCKKEDVRWEVANWAGVIVTAFATAWLAPNWRKGTAAGALLLALPYVQFNLTHPVLVDAPAMALATLSAALMHNGAWPLAIVLALAAGAAKESAPLFAAAYAGNVVPLIGLLAPLLRYLDAVPDPTTVDEYIGNILRHPFRAGKDFHWNRLRAHDSMFLLPWGAALIGLAHPSWRLALVLGLAYAQLCIATDSVRLYQWAAPTLCLAAVDAVPAPWWSVLIALTWFNPARGDGG